MQNKELYSQFKKLQTVDFSEDKFTVVPISDTLHKISVTREGYPMFFLATTDSASHVENTMLNILSVEYNLSCTFIDDDNSSTETQYTVITLHSLEEILLESFFDLMLLMLERLPQIPSKKEISIEVENLVSIFSAMTCPPRKKIQGLWTELLVIEQSANPTIVAKAWHEKPSSKYDFTMGKDKIEVKSTSNAARIHHFSLEQLTPSIHSRIVVASSIVRESASGNGGFSINDLYNKICKKVLSADIRIHIMKVIVETIGSDIHKSKDVCFDYIEACDSLRFYDANDIPRVDKNGVQQGVTSVGFSSNLTGVTDILNENSPFVIGNSVLYQALFNK